MKDSESRWERISELFAAALEVEAEARPELLEGEGDDPEIKKEVAALLAAHEAGGPVATGSGSSPGALVARLLEPVEAGDRVGSWRIVRRLGAGGMGVVYLAQRDDPSLPQKAAVKVLRLIGADEDALARFLSERRIAARLDHPGIARLYDAGVSESGDPWYAMEYVEGRPIDRYCTELELDVERRIELVLDVCGAVSHAHQRLVVHRDLKPANILVGDDERPRLLDFGIAGILKEDGAADTALTLAGRRWFTPEYASPEQVAGDPVTTASDVYSLGVLLYRLLTDRPPYDLPVAPLDQARAIRESEPIRPSTRVSHGGDGTGASADERSRRLAGDLDVIVLKALEKEPERRYATVDRLAEDLRRHLLGQPVEAREPTLAYRMSKFVRRHRLGVAAGALVALSILGGLAGTLWQARLAAEQARVAREERDKARLEAAKAEQVAAFLTELFEIADPGIHRGETVTAREILDRGAERIDRDLAGQPAVQAEMMHVIGGVYSNLGLYEDARALLEGALDRQRSLYGEEHLDYSRTLRQLGLVHQRAGDLEAAESTYRRSLELLRAHGGSATEIAAGLRDLAFVLRTVQRTDEAETLLEEALDLVGDAPSVDRAGVVYGLAALYHDQGAFQEAEALFRETIELYDAQGGKGHPDAASAMEDLATVMRFGGRLEQARDLYQRCLAMRIALFGERHPAVADALQHLAAVTHELSDYAEAAELARRGYDTSVAVRGDDHPDTARARQELATALRSLGQVGEAQRLFDATLRQHRNLYGPEHPFVLLTLIQTAECRFESGDLEGALRGFREAEALARKLFGAEHSMVAAGQRLAGKVLTAQGRLDEAVPLLRESLDTTLGMLRESHPHNLAGKTLLADALVATGRLEEAESLYRSALAGLEDSLPDDHAGLAPALGGLGSLLLGSGRVAEAEPLLARADAILSQRLPEEHPRRLEAARRLAACRRELSGTG